MAVKESLLYHKGKTMLKFFLKKFKKKYFNIKCNLSKMQIIFSLLYKIKKRPNFNLAYYGKFLLVLLFSLRLKNDNILIMIKSLKHIR